jgi:hypothetical protein
MTLSLSPNTSVLDPYMPLLQAPRFDDKRQITQCLHRLKTETIELAMDLL